MHTPLLRISNPQGLNRLEYFLRRISNPSGRLADLRFYFSLSGRLADGASSTSLQISKNGDFLINGDSPFLFFLLPLHPILE